MRRCSTISSKFERKWDSIGISYALKSFRSISERLVSVRKHFLLLKCLKKICCLQKKFATESYGSNFEESVESNLFFLTCFIKKAMPTLEKFIAFPDEEDFEPFPLTKTSILISRCCFLNFSIVVTNAVCFFQQTSIFNGIR